MRTLVAFRGNILRTAGATIRARLAISALAQLGPVDLVTLEEQPNPDVEQDAIVARSLGIAIRQHHRIRVHARPLSQRDRLLWLTTGDHPRRLVAADLVAESHEIADRIDAPYDLSYAITDRAALALPMNASQRRVVDLIDFEAPRDLAIAKEGVQAARNSRARLLAALRLGAARVDARRLRQTIDRLLSNHDVVAVSSDLDRELLARPAVRVIPNGYPEPAIPLGRVEADRVAPCFLLAGFYPYGPNTDAAVWFCSAVLPLLRHAIPGARVRLVGAPSAEVRSLARFAGVTVVGEVDTMDEELRAADAIVVPLRSGSGTRIKILEAWAHRIPVVTTSFGAAGLPIGNRSEALIADDEQLFAAACQEVIVDRDLRAKLTGAGETRFRANFSEQRVADDILRLVKSL